MSTANNNPRSPLRCGTPILASCFSTRLCSPELSNWLLCRVCDWSTSPLVCPWLQHLFQELGRRGDTQIRPHLKPGEARLRMTGYLVGLAKQLMPRIGCRQQAACAVQGMLLIDFQY